MRKMQKNKLLKKMNFIRWMISDAIINAHNLMQNYANYGEYFAFDLLSGLESMNSREEL